MGKAALVELLITPKDVAYASTWSVEQLQEELRRDPQSRERAVRTALELAVKGGADLIVFPGWTVVEDRPPSWMLRASKGRTIAFECLFPRGGKTKHHARGNGEEWPSWRTFVARDGVVLIDATQRLAQASQRQDPEHGPRLLDDIKSGKRSCNNMILWICGEVEILMGGSMGGGAGAVRNETGLTDHALRAGGIVLNPAHTRAKPSPSASKRAWLSIGGWLLTTANLHPGGLGRHAGRASSTAAMAWRNGSRSKGNSRQPVTNPTNMTLGAITWIDIH